MFALAGAAPCRLRALPEPPATLPLLPAGSHALPPPTCECDDAWPFVAIAGSNVMRRLDSSISRVRLDSSNACGWTPGTHGRGISGSMLSGSPCRKPCESGWGQFLPPIKLVRYRNVGSLAEMRMRVARGCAMSAVTRMGDAMA